MSLTILKIAARNVFKDRHRSIAVFNAVVLSMGVLTFALGLLIGMREMFLALAFDTIGHARIQRQGYLEQSSTLPVHLLIDNGSGVLRTARAEPNVAAATEELVFGGMITASDFSTEMLVRGVDVVDGAWNKRYRQAIKAGRFPAAPGDAMVGGATARYLKLRPGDRLTVMAYNPNGGINAVETVLAGTFETDKTEENESLLLLPIETARKLLQAPGASTSVLVRLSNSRELNRSIAALQSKFGPSGLTAHSWKEVYAEVAVGLVWVNTIIALLFSIIVAVVVVGIINTLLISVFERIGVFGTMRSIGLSKVGLIGMVMGETGLIGSAGSVLGVSLGALAIRLVAIKGIDMGPELDGIARIIYPAFSPEIAAFCFVVGTMVSLFGASTQRWWPAG